MVSTLDSRPCGFWACQILGSSGHRAFKGMVDARNQKERYHRPGLFQDVMLALYIESCSPVKKHANGFFTF